MCSPNGERPAARGDQWLYGERPSSSRGGASGIGRAYAEAFAQAGADVVIADTDVALGSRAAEELTAAGGSVLFRRADVTDWDDLVSLVEGVTEAFRSIDVLVNNAAVYATLRKKPFEEISRDEWEKVMAVNLTGVFLTCKAVVPAMRKAGGGRIINISSSTVVNGNPFFLHYVTSKAGIVGFTRALAREVGESNITVNAVLPGLVTTENNAHVGDEYFDAVAASRSIKRREAPEDVVGAVLFLAEDASGFITGQSLVVDGGLVMH
ncbi:MAG: 3-oxoacyl-ACP reductase FabG [Actinobacteria bacterium]|nr:3-oxoacyl-ACP reductase FabG [Actinomycetota bacterium]